MNKNASIGEVYDKSGCSRYKSFVNFFFYPFGIRDFIFKKIILESGAKVLDAGCGFGVLSKAVHDKVRREALTGVEQHAFDISPDMLSAFREMGLDDIAVRQLDVRDLSYEDDYFDFVVTSAMLEYVPDIDKGLASLKRCLKPGGKIYVFMSQKSRVNKFLFRSFGNPKYYSPKELTDIFTSLGFQNIQRRKFPPTSFWLNLWGFIIEASK